MTSKHNPLKRSALATAVLLALGVAPTEQALAVSCNWNPATGNWSAGGNWSCAVVPGASDSATIAVSKVVTINTAQSILNLTNSGGVNIDAFLLNLAGGGATTNTGTINVGAGPIPNNAALQVGGGHNITNTGGVINISADSVVNQFGSTITGGTINTTGTGKVVAFNSSSNFLDGVKLNGTLDLATNTGIERVTGGLTLNGTVNVNNNSFLVFQGDQTLSGAGTIVLGDTGSSNRLSIDGDTVLTLGSNTVVRGQNGTIGQAVFVGGTQSLINNGRISADVSGGTLNLSPNGGTTNNGVLEAKNGGTLVLNSNVTGTVGSHIDVAATSTIVQNGVSLNGVINAAGAGSFRATNSGSNFLNAATFTGTLDLATNTGIERVTGGLTLNGAVNVNNNSVLVFQGDQTLSGAGTIVLGDTGSSNRLGIDGNTVLTLGSNTVVRGQNGTIGQAVFVGGAQSLINNGRISADVSGGTLNLSPNGGTTNNGVLEAKNGGTLVLNSNVTGTVGSHIDVAATSTIVQNGVSLNGVINAAGAGSFRATNSGSNFLNSATFNGTLDLATSTSIERVTGGLILNGAVNVNNNSVLVFQGDQTLSGAGTIVLGDTGSSNRLGIDGNTVLTLGSNTVVRGQNGTIGQAVFVGGAQSLINNGRISVDVSGGTFHLAPNGGTTNNGVLEAKNGGTLVLDSNVIGNSGGSIVIGAGSTVLQNGVAVSGVINATGTGLFQATNSGNNFLNAATFNGTLDLATNTGIERVSGGLTLNGTVKINNNSVLSFSGSQTLSGTGTIVLGDTGPSNRALGIEGDTVLTIGSDIVVRGQNGTIGQAIFVGGAQSLINNGRISADVSGGTFHLAPNGGTTNNGVLEAKNGGTLVLDSNVIGNSGGSIVIGAGSTVLQNGVSVSGVINATGTGLFQATNNGSNFLNAATFNGTLDLATNTGIERVTGGLTLNGTVNVNNNSVLSFSGDQTLGGVGSIVLGDTGASNRALGLEGNTVLTIGSNTVVRGKNGTIGQAIFTGGTQSLINNGTINSDGGGTLTVGVATSLTNNGTLRAQSGTLTVQNALTGTGTLRVDPTGVLNLANSANTQGSLVLGAAGSTLNIGTQNLTINTDYTNTAAGSGNSFDRRAGISGTGQVLAGGDVAQAITGAGVTNGNTANATLTIGNVRVGGSTVNYQVANIGTTGPSLRGAIQTSANGASLTDARLTGPGVTPSNYNAGAPGSNSGDLGVTFTVGTAGALAPLTGQVVNLRSNFENVADQKLNIVLASGAAAYNLANPTLNTPAITLVARVGDTAPTASISLTNTSPNIYTERLNASIGPVAAGFSGSGSITGLVAGASSSALGVVLNTNSAGTFAGTAAVNLVSSGVGTTGAADFALAGKSVALTGRVYTPAVAQVNTTTVDFGIVHRGDVVAVRNVSVTNAAATTALNDTLHGSIGTAAPAFSATGTVAALGAQATDSSSLNVGLNTTNAGVFNGTATASFSSHNADLADAALGSSSITLKGQVNNFADVALTKMGAGAFSLTGHTYTLDFGSISLGAGPRNANLAVLNSAVGPADVLGGNFDATHVGTGFTLNGFGSFSNLIAGDSHGGLSISFLSGTAGAFESSVLLHASGSNASGYLGALADTTLVLRGNVITAVPEPGTYVLMFAGLLVVVGATRARRRQESESVA